MAGTKADAKTEMGNTAATAAGGGGSGGSFSEQRLVEKLNKLNNSAASIQTLSQWCIFYRKRARSVVDTWEKEFNSATNDKKVSYLYLSNDILQNSRRKGAEYVNEFWRVLPRSLKDVYENGEEEGKKVVARLIEIWDERKVLGTRIKSLKHDILGNNLPTLDSNGKNSNPGSSNSKSARKESSTIIKKLTVGGMPEKIVTAYQSVLDKHFDEDTTLNKCKSIVGGLEKIKKDVDDACKYGTQQGSLISDLQEQEIALKQCTEQLEIVNTARATLINQLREALNEQESMAALLINQLQVARAGAECVRQLRQGLSLAPTISGEGSRSGPIMNAPPSEQTSVVTQGSGVRSVSPQLQPLRPATSASATVSVVSDEPKKTAAAMADKLVSLSSPGEFLSSVLGTLAAQQQAASVNTAPPSGSGELSATATTGPPGFQLEKRPRLELTQAGGGMSTPPFLGQVPQQIGLGGVRVPASVGTGPFAMMAGSMPPPPPLSNILPTGFPPAQTQPRQQSPQAPQQPSTSALQAQQQSPSVKRRQ